MNRLADKTEQWPTAKLLPYARNARIRSEEQMAQIAANTAEFGFANPILAGGDGIIVTDHGRLAAIQKPGLERVPVIVLDHLTPTQHRALIIIGNRIAESADWDDAMLEIESETLQLEGFGLDIIGFDADTLAELIAGDEPDNEGQTDEDAMPEVNKTPISRPGDIWIMGQHRLLCGDSIVVESYDHLIQGAVAGMAFTDPPYNVNCANSAKDKMCSKSRVILNNNPGDVFYGSLLTALTPTVAHYRGSIYVTISSSKLDVLQTALRVAGSKWSTSIIWAKNTFALEYIDYQRQYESILYGWPEGATRHRCDGHDQGDARNIKKPQRNDLHPTMKPMELVERAIRNSSRPGNVVLDPFGDSGTALTVTEKSRRVARLIEFNSKYVDVIVCRRGEFTRRQAIHETDGTLLDQMVDDSLAISQ